jgi:uncharacterized Zn finger protein (UPF0148 family)
MTNDEVLEYLDVPFKFWRCPDCESPTIKWKGDLAICCRCGKTNNHETNQSQTTR